MRYRENREQTAELLRMVLPLMSRHAAGFHPLSFAVWYEYAAGTNQALKAAVDARVATSVRLTDADIEELFDRHVAMRDIESSMKVRARIQEVVEQVTETTHQASMEVGRYNDGLNEYQQRLKRDVDKAAITEVVMGLIGDTDRVRSRTTDLQNNLVENSREARRLQGELEIAQGKAQVDPLTGLLNGRGLDYRVRDSYPAGLPAGTLLRFGIDEFMNVGDNLGNLLADRVLAAIGQLISNGAGQGSLLARTAGEDFVLLLPGRAGAEALEQAERIRASVERCRVRRQDSETAVTTVTVSIGAVMLDGGESLESAIERADQAMARSRREGGNRISVGGD
ncbi:MAG: GGDEF domain-containing protein [Gammaproteobacteria bacterium]|nr:GGDEF domain-containing protein [Gammaproteobacteria bacterium]MDE2251539.1 GGDEF domain-containing protein [Gammaproteobacteria bacterium]